ncbi:group II intron reverse transcriptase/maturase [Klebsiella pneumoniae]
MTTQEIACAGAPSHESVTWHSIDWAECHREVRRLQARIVKATREGRHGRVKALQWILTHSFSGKALAVRRVTENQGKRTPGVDGITWSTPEAKSQATLSLKRRGYRPQPLKRVSIPKANGKMRPLGIPTMKDRAMQALYLLALEPVAETTADRRSFGYRLERSTADAIEQCFTALARGISPKWILEGDIKGCFDNISHDWLLGHAQTDREILSKWLKAGYMEDRQLFPTEAGTPQGGIISPTLANLVLDGLETRLLTKFGRPRYANGGETKLMVNYVRYADDFIVTGRSKELLEQEVMPLIEEFMRERGLTLSPEKTKITHIDEGFDFLGQNVRKYDGKLLIKPSKANVATFVEKVRTVIKGNKALNQKRLIWMLNPMIQGWANYHHHVVSKETFARVDHEIWSALWQWAKRRHPQKGSAWVKQRYFQSAGTRNWMFAAATGERYPDGKPILAILRKASDTPIKRHRSIKADANPFDPKWEMYFEERMSLKMQNSLRGRKKLINLWMDQDRCCPICQQLITQETGWHVHHIIRRVDGGKDGSTNLVMVHPNCHNQIHVNGLKVVKPVRESGL